MSPGPSEATARGNPTYANAASGRERPAGVSAALRTPVDALQKSSPLCGMKRVPHPAQPRKEAQSEFERECAALRALATEVEKINRRLRAQRATDSAQDLQRRSELLTSWWSEWSRLAQWARRAGVPLADLRDLQPPIV